MSKTDHKPLFDVVFSLLANEPGKDNEFFPTGRALCTLQLNQRGFTTVTFKIMRRTPRWSLPGCANHEGPRAPRAGPSAGGRGTGPPPRDAAAGQDAPQNPCPGRSCGTGRPPEPLPGTRPRDTKLPPPQEPLPRARASPSSRGNRRAHRGTGAPSGRLAPARRPASLRPAPPAALTAFFFGTILSVFLAVRTTSSSTAPAGLPRAGPRGTGNERSWRGGG